MHVRGPFRGPHSFQALCPVCPIQQYFRALPEAHKDISKSAALNTWAHLLLNHVHTGHLGATMSWLQLSPAFSFGWSPNLWACEHPASCDHFLYQQTRHPWCVS